MENLNNKIKGFPYDPSSRNKPPEISENHLSNGKIVFSASEMLTLIRNILLIIDFEINEKDEHYLKIGSKIVKYPA